MIDARRLGTAAGLSLILLGTCAATASASPRSSDAGIYEQDMTNTPDLKEGQPSVAVNPKNPNNLVFVSTIFPPAPQLEPVDGGCFLAYSFDRGRTWHQVAWPLGDAAPKCGEPIVATDAKGTFYISNNEVSSGLAANLVNHNQVSRSTDGGRTWTGPAITPLLLGGAPKMRVDLATGKVYAVAGNVWEYPSAVSVSSDGGRSFGAPSVIPGPMPCIQIAPGIPEACGYPGREIAVYGGILAAASPGDDGAVKFHVTRDDGRHWTSLTVTGANHTPVPNGTGALVPVPALGAAADPTPWISADPSHRGRFAVMVPRDSNLEVYVTNDAGHSWTGPAVINAPDARRPWFDFGPNGDIGVMWRTTALDTYSAVSVDHGRTFSRTLKVNQTTEPAGEAGPPGDRWSNITLTDKYAYISWADGRNGPLDTILAEVPLNLYRQH